MSLDFSALRSRMIKEQLLTRGIEDKPLLEAFEHIPRERFVPEKCIRDTYIDSPLSIGSGQTISQPYITALMIQCLGLRNTDSVLEIGTGSGYQTALLAQLVKQVYTVERKPELSRKAELRLKDLAFDNICFKVDDGTYGWPEFAPYDAVLVSAAAPKLPPPLIEQLKLNGRLIIPLGRGFNQTLTVIQKQKGLLKEERLCSCVFVPLIGKYGWRKTNA